MKPNQDTTPSRQGARAAQVNYVTAQKQAEELVADLVLKAVQGQTKEQPYEQA